ncbi:MAG: alpha/beta hydrolase [Planctomycetes bacterium]|nr:alpha/beta hydrolase [Planctomycetota bacterium]
MRSTKTILVLLVSFLSSACWGLEIQGFTPDKSVIYKTVNGVDLKIHLFYPSKSNRSDKMPAIVFFFGGGWVSGSPSQFYPHCEYFASRGMVAMSAEYRVEKAHATTPQECVKDGKSAIRWIRQHARQFAIDPNAIVAAGGSAGGHVAAATGTLTKYVDSSDDTSVCAIPNALVLFNPVFDNGPTGWGYDRVKEYWQDISPLHNIKADTPPTIIFLGTKDTVVSVLTAQRYKEKMEHCGRRCDLVLYEGQKHGFFNYTNSEYFQKTIQEADRFLVSLGFLKKRSSSNGD